MTTPEGGEMPESPFPATPFNVPICPKCGGYMRRKFYEVDKRTVGDAVYHTGEEVLACDIHGSAVEPKWVTVEEEPE
jgi:hypothetical protein